MGRSTCLLLALLAAPACPAMGQGAVDAPSLEVVGTMFRVTTPDQRVVASPELVGAILDVTDEEGGAMTVRIDAVTRDRSDPDGEIWLHRFSVVDTATRSWHELCAPGSDGTVGGFPVAGRWTHQGRHLHGSSSDFTITCTSGAIGKCVRFGYKPWREIRGESLWDYHQACVRMVRADYGGDGTSHTRDGTLIDIYDRLGIQTIARDSSGRASQFEAAWGPGGAVCIRRTRIASGVSTQELAAQYPRLASRIGPNCSEATPALIWNRS